MKYRLLSFATIVIGLALSLLLGSAEISAFDQIFLVASPILQGISLLTGILLLTGLCVAANRLLRIGHFWQLFRYFWVTATVISLLAQFLAFLVAKIPFLPVDRIPDVSRIQSSLSVFRLKAEMWEQMINAGSLFDWGSVLSGISGGNYAIWLVFACAIAFVMLSDSEAAEPTYNLVDSVSRLIFQLLQNIFVLLSVYLIFVMIYTVWQVRSDELLVMYAGFLARLIAILALLFCIAPLILFFVYRDKKAFAFIWQTFLSIFSSFFTGHSLFSMGVLIVEQRNRLAMPRNVSGVLNPLNLLFFRPGSAIVLAYSFITYYSNTTRWQMGFSLELLWLIIVPIIFSIIIGLLFIPSYFMILPVYFLLFGLSLTDNFIIMAPVLLIGQSFANCIDVFSWNLLNYIYIQFYNDV